MISSETYHSKGVNINDGRMCRVPCAAEKYRSEGGKYEWGAEKHITAEENVNEEVRAETWEERAKYHEQERN